MAYEPTPTRRVFLGQMAGLGALLARPQWLLGAQEIPSRGIPGTQESLPIIGFGSSTSSMKSRGRITIPIPSIANTNCVEATRW